MPSKPLTTRVAPIVHDRLVAMAERRGASLAATAAALLSAAVADGDEGSAPQPDGSLVAAVHALLSDVTAPKAVMHREVAVRLARSVERGERGAIAAAELLMTTADKALSAQREADNPGGDVLGLDGDLNGLLGRLGF
ncbi:hypothetical protein [Streptomyces sp. TRM68367]|uniref:hypothetical protein n=1 Tax=Streptomyces sp. TRM68367 TaxID=2758415 RepID=UPI00165AAFCB|nr:hypothetical protein [Streptomyces sp. TRM68367]MBC9728094.1 hypothetical protein [Streptomyces sp. TRM68367]